MNVNSPEITVVAVHWPELANSVFVPHSEAEYQRLVALTR